MQRYFLTHRLHGSKDGFAAGLPLHFVVEVTHDTESGMWIAQCDDLGVVTEARSYEALVSRLYDIAPQMLAENFAIPPNPASGHPAFRLDRLQPT